MRLSRQRYCSFSSSGAMKSLHVYVSVFVRMQQGRLVHQRCECGHASMSRVHTSEQVFACTSKRQERESDRLFSRERERESESQGQRVIRLFSVRPGKLSSLGDEKWLYGSMRVIEFCCTAKREDEKESKGKKNMHMIPAVATSCLLIISHFEQMPNHDAKDGKSA